MLVSVAILNVLNYFVNVSHASEPGDEPANVFLFNLEGLRDEDYLNSAELTLTIDKAAQDKSSSHPGKFQLNLLEIVRNHSLLLDTRIVHCDTRQDTVRLDAAARPDSVVSLIRIPPADGSPS